MISTVCLLDRHTPLGPRAVSASLDYLGARLAGQQGGGKADPTAVSVVALDSEVSAGDLQASLASPSPQVKCFDIRKDPPINDQKLNFVLECECCCCEHPMKLQ